MLCKSCGKNISVNEEKCPVCGSETGFLKGIDGNDSPEKVEMFSALVGGGSFRNSEKIRSLELINKELEQELEESERRYRSKSIVAVIEAVIIAVLVVVIAVGGFFVLSGDKSTGGNQNDDPATPSTPIGTSSQDVYSSDSSFVSGVVSDVAGSSSDIVSDNVVSNEVTTSGTQNSAYKAAWDALNGVTLESVTDNGSGGTNTREMHIKSADAGRYSVSFYTNGVHGGDLTATLNESNGKLSGVTEKGVDFTVEMTKNNKGVTVYVVTGTNFYYGKYYAK